MLDHPETKAKHHRISCKSGPCNGKACNAEKREEGGPNALSGRELGTAVLQPVLEDTGRPLSGFALLALTKRLSSHLHGKLS